MKFFSRATKAHMIYYSVSMLVLMGCELRARSALKSSNEIIAIPAQNGPVLASFGAQNEFFFGSAVAPAHAEDGLNDGWLDFARQGKVAAFNNYVDPEKRINFWTDPEKEIDLVANSGAKVFRMGVDWQRLSPHRPGSKDCGGICPQGVQDVDALKRYKQIVKLARGRGLDVMLTLFHHSMPKWGIEMGGWTNPQLVPMFVAFSKDIIQSMADDVDLWITINEPVPFLLFTYVAGIWPGGTAKNIKEFINFGPLYKGDFSRGFENMVEAHKQIYAVAHQFDRVIASGNLPHTAAARVGIANNIAVSAPARPIIDQPMASFFSTISKFQFFDAIINTVDFIGLNYYGREFVKDASVEIKDGHEFSDSGRALYPQGLYQFLKDYHSRYNVEHKNRQSRVNGFEPIPMIITENGIADSLDVLRPSYLIEHLLAVAAARSEGVPVDGFVLWTMSDNLEWALGYCPKFGLAAVDRSNGFKRVLRDSYFLFKNIASSGKIYETQRKAAWNRVRANVGKPHPLCVSMDGKTPLNEPISRNIVDADWRFFLPEK